MRRWICPRRRCAFSAGRDAIQAWRQNQASDDQVWIINWLIKNDLLPNKMEECEPVRLLVSAYRATEKQIADPKPSTACLKLTLAVTTA